MGTSPLLLALLALFAFQAFALVGNYDSTFDFNTEPLFRLHWSVNEETELLSLALEVETTGWVAFGIPEQTSGSMQGSDMLIGWVDDNTGAVYVEDRHALAKATPLLDDCQSWNLVAGEQTETTTIIEVTRVLDTEDSSDRVIFSGLGKIVWAHSPDNTDAFGYHSTSRKADGFTFYGEPGTEAPTGDTITEWTWTNDNYLIPTDETTYAQFQGYFPSEVVAYKHHLIRFEALIDPVAKPYVHHYVLQGCVQTVNCSKIWGWAPGVAPYSLPAEAGFAIGTEEGDYDSFDLEVHFNNPGGVEGDHDNSGIIFWFDSELRQFDAAMIQVGDPAIQEDSLGQGSSTKSFEYTCPGVCTSEWPTNITIFGDTLHMHAQGAMMWSTLHRNGEQIAEMNRIEFFDYNFQELTPVSFTLQPGDRINTHCVFNQDPNRDVPFGLASVDEMCIEFLYYYPRIVGNDFCGLWNSGFKGTLCNDGVLPVDQPTVPDAPGAEVIRFAATEAATCPVVVTELVPDLSSSSSESSSAAASSSESSSSVAPPSEASSSATSSSEASSSVGSVEISAGGEVVANMLLLIATMPIFI